MRGERGVPDVRKKSGSSNQERMGREKVNADRQPAPAGTRKVGGSLPNRMKRQMQQQRVQANDPK
ncbi:hypothetical protein GCM10022406_04530 [Hymenobacter algoricola]|uniref:Uncharacterized protein n=1 Tax=Hymenobacter algoricola TaxID=486267 RepID=A0ABP7MIV9_9BACT